MMWWVPVQRKVAASSSSGGEGAAAGASTSAEVSLSSVDSSVTASRMWIAIAVEKSERLQCSIPDINVR